MKRLTRSVILVLMLALVAAAGCSTEVLQMGPNGDAKLRYLDIKGSELLPAWSPTTYSYVAVVPDPARAQLLVQPFIAFTGYTINGQKLAMNTNVYGLPVHTPFNMTGLSELRVVTRAEDGFSRTYTVTLLDPVQADAGLTAIGSVQGVFAPRFVEGGAPNYVSYRAPGASDVNNYTLVVTNLNYNLDLVKSSSNAVLTVNGSVTGAGVKSATAALVHPGSGTQTVMVTNISPNGMFTNVKSIAVTYAAPATDARALQVRFFKAGTDEEISYLPTFNPGKSSSPYSLVLDNVTSVRLAVTTAQPGATVIVIQESLDETGLYNGYNSYSGKDISYIPCEMGDRITVCVTQGGVQKNYVWEVTMFTSSTGYGFNGGIGNFLRFIHDRKEYGSNEEYMTVTGIVTYNVSGDDGFFIEDGEYGLYVWAGWYNKPAGLRVGQKVKIDFKYAKLWMGLAEIAYQDAYKVNMILQTMVDRKPRPLFYQNTTQWYTMADPTLEIYRHSARLVRYKTTTPIVAGFDSSWTGQFTPSYSFKLAEDYGNVEYTRTYSDAVKYMREGVNGTFFGPLLFDGTMYLFAAHKQFMIIPQEDRMPE